MRSGGTFIVSEQPSHLRQQFWDDMNTYRVTDFSGVPSTYNEIVEREFMDLFPESIVNLTQAGGKLDIEMQNVLLNRCKMTDINLYIMYGQTEASARLTYLKLTEDQGKIGSVGKVIPGE